MKVECEVENAELDGDDADSVPGICVKCGRCDHTVEVFGHSLRSVRRGLIMLREECPEDEKNFYVAATDEDPGREE